MGLIPPVEYIDYEWFDTATPLTPAELELADCEPSRRRETEMPSLSWAVQSPPDGITRTYNRGGSKTPRPTTTNRGTPAATSKQGARRNSNGSSRSGTTR